jgi:drug/metabolite transporter (DMT)-like permease
MSSPLLFAGAVLTWGATPFATKNQLDVVAPEMLVAYRFGLAGLLLIGWCAWRGRSLRFNWRHHPFIAMQGVLLFGLVDVGTYNAVARLTSGLMPVVFSLAPVATVFLGAALIGLKIRPRMVLAGGLGLVGVAMVFLPELRRFEASGPALAGLGYALAGTVALALGSLAASRNQKAGLPIVETAALGMAYGAAFTFVMSLALGGEVLWDPSLGFLAGFIWVTLMASILAFLSYLTLIDRIGPDRVAYVYVVVPIVALAISTVFEDYTWTAVSGLGVVVVVVGSVLALRQGRARPAGARLAS